MAAVNIRNVGKQFDSVIVMRNIDLDVADGEFIVLVGASGCGKSTLLRMIAGLEPITSGEIAIGGRRVNELEPRERDVAMVFQSYALYPHLDVRENMSFSLRLRKRPPADIERQVEATATTLDLQSLLARLPRALSGGQRQRVAMGRAIVRHPQLFLFDEPLSKSRCEASRRDAHRDSRAAPAAARDVDLRDTRSGRSDDDGGPHGGDERRSH